MRKNVLTTIMVISTGFAQAQWINQNVPFGYEGFIYDIETVDVNTVWGTPYDNSTGTASATSNFIRTTDGGNTWTVGITSGAASAGLISNIWPIDDQTCYVAMYNSTSSGGGIYKTTDGGATWNLSGTNMFNQATSFPDFVWFHDPQNGVAVGDPIGASPYYYEIFVTSDSGTTWSGVTYPNLPYVTSVGEYGVVNLFTTSQGHIWFGTSEGDIYHSADMGHYWTKSASGFPPYISNGSRYDISDLAFTDSLNGIIMQINATSYLVKRTTDGGATWIDINPSANLYLSDIDAVPGSQLLVSAGSSNAGGFGTSFSMDYGSTWTVIDTGASHTSIDFTDNMTGYSGEFISAGASGGAWKYTGAPLSVISHFVQSTEIQIYPNPSHGVINIIGKSNSKNTTLELFDMQGKNILNKSFETLNVFNLPLSLTGISPGIYTLKITEGKDFSMHKIVME